MDDSASDAQTPLDDQTLAVLNLAKQVAQLVYARFPTAGDAHRLDALRIASVLVEQRPVLIGDSAASRDR